MSGTERAKYREIVAQYADQINKGHLPPGTRLPTERQLAAEMGVNRSTVVAAYDELRASGLVERRQGSGTYVSGALWGVTPDWSRYINGGAFEPTQPILQRIRAVRSLPGMINLSEGVLSQDLTPHALIEQILRRATLKPNLGYPPELGDRRLREVLADDLEARGGTVSPESVLITSGSQQGLYLLLRTLLSPGDAVAIEQPSYYYSLSVFQSAGVRLFPLPVDEHGLDPAAIRPLFQRHRIRMVICNPTFQNPTTTTLSLPRRLALLEVCRSLNLPIVEDEVFRDLYYTDAPPPPLRALDKENRVIGLGTLSKCAAPALRIGWVTGPKPVIDTLADLKHQIDFGTSIISQALAADLLSAPEWTEHLDRLRQALRRRRDVLAAEMQAAFGSDAQFALPEGGLHLWVRWQRAASDRQRLQSAIAAGVLVAPGRLYGMEDGWDRLTFGTAPEGALREGVRRLARAVDALGQEGGAAGS